MRLQLKCHFCNLVIIARASHFRIQDQSSDFDMGSTTVCNVYVNLVPMAAKLQMYVM